MKAEIDNKEAVKAFDKQSLVFDEIYRHNIIIDYKRERTRGNLERFLKKGDKLLELNAGTGDDAIYFAQKGYQVHATDISEGMLQQLKKKVNKLNLWEAISYEQVSFTDLKHIKKEEVFDAIFSNFGGLNCTNQLESVLASFSGLLKTGGHVTLVIMPSFCLWEFLHFFRGHFKVAFRRFFSKNGAKAHIEGVHFLCWYYKPEYIIERLKAEFEVVNLEGLCAIVPPSYMENFPYRYPQLYSFLKKTENKLKGTFPINRIGDYFIITLKKK